MVDESRLIVLEDKNAMPPPTFIPKSKKRKKHVITEEDFVEDISNIIERDFYPDLPRLRNQLEWLEAEKHGDVDKMKQIQDRALKLKHKRQKLNPKTNSNTDKETPQMYFSSGSEWDDTPELRNKTELDKSNTKKKDDTDLPLDKYLHNHVSEDDDSFEKLIEKQNEQLRSKTTYAEEIIKIDNNLKMLSDGGASDKSQRLLTTNYEPQNSLIFYPNGASQAEVAAFKGPKEEIVHSATRFQAPVYTQQKTTQKDEKYPHLSANKAPESFALLSYLEKAKNQKTKFDLTDFKGTPKQDPTMSPQVGNYGFISTPTIHPGEEDDEPIMTWGSLDGTPLLLDPSNTPTLNSFVLSETPGREKLALDLADKAKRTSINTPSRKTPIHNATNTPSRSPYLSSPSLQSRYSGLSDAAKKLLHRNMENKKKKYQRTMKF